MDTDLQQPDLPRADAPVPQPAPAPVSERQPDMKAPDLKVHQGVLPAQDAEDDVEAWRRNLSCNC